MSTELALVDDRHYMDRLPALADRLAKSQLIPKRFQNKPDDIAVIGYTLADLDVRLTPATLAQMYAVDNTPGFMAQIQSVLAARHGCPVIPLDDESDDTLGRCLIRAKDGKWRTVDVTIDEAKAAGWYDRNPNYKTQPKNMLLNRAVTKAVRLHCPEAKLVAALEAVDRPTPIDVDVIPAEVHDSAAESRGFGGELQAPRYDPPDDDGRPFTDDAA